MLEKKKSKCGDFKTYLQATLVKLNLSQPLQKPITVNCNFTAGNFSLDSLKGKKFIH